MAESERSQPVSRPASERVVLEPLAELIPESDKARRKVMTNLDRIAQGALDAVRNYTNKHGEECSIPQPDWNVAVKAMESAKVLLGLDAEPGASGRDGGTESPVDRIKRLAVVPGGQASK